MTARTQMDRRTFISYASAGVATAVAPLVLPSRVCMAGPDAPSNKLNVSLIGCGGRGADILGEAIGLGVNVIALCDADVTRIANTRKLLIERRPEARAALERATGYEDYRTLLEKEKSLDGVLIAIGAWWHAPMSAAFMKAGKHVYCEKPLTRLVSEARELGNLARASKVATQMGTQGVGGEAFRRSVEIVQSGLLGVIREVHVWNNHNSLRPPSHDRPPGEDPVPAGFNWDLFVGPSPLRPFKRDTYYPGTTTTSVWFDFGAGLLGDFGVHTWQLPIRALKLDYPVRVEHNVPEPVKETYASSVKSRYDFAARGDRGPVTVWYCDTIHHPPQEATADLEATYGKVPTLGAMLLGDKGTLYAGGWGGGNLMKLKGEAKMRGVSDHPAAKSLPVTEPRAPQQNHMLEWIEAAKGGPKTYQPFEVAAHSMEVMLPGIVALRMQRPIDWDGANMKVPGAPEADKFIHADYRRKWLI
ncbi:MAG: Gfo/Idh/MocA family oxidoreductase [Planctomycetota bacterium]|nr:Gfo/Idh/MocA family oxidoreductase [Planctomycetota bacterium]